jgi:hypothetical protein
VKKRVVETVKLWTPTERNRFEKSLMSFGYARWDKVNEACRHRSIDDLKVCWFDGCTYRALITFSPLSRLARECSFEMPFDQRMLKGMSLVMF